MSSIFQFFCIKFIQNLIKAHIRHHATPKDKRKLICTAFKSTLKSLAAWNICKTSKHTHYPSFWSTACRPIPNRDKWITQPSIRYFDASNSLIKYLFIKFVLDLCVQKFIGKLSFNLNAVSRLSATINKWFKAFVWIF